MNTNPFDISFGKKPIEVISRFRLTKEITDTLTAEQITQQIYLLTGVRGSGKTVLMNSIANDLESEKKWIVIRLNPVRDLLQSLGAKLCSQKNCLALFRQAEIDLSIFGMGINIDNDHPVADVETAIERMLLSLKKHNKRVLVTIDEVTDNSYIREFCSAFQILTGEELPIFLLMTGLYDNIEELQNEKNLTFLYRAPKVRMDPLNLGTIASRYGQIFSLSIEEARRLSALTKGYPFAFQALGYSLWNHGAEKDAYMDDYRQILEEYVYEKIWSELSVKDRFITKGIANCPDGRIQTINSYLGLKTNEINQYRKRLMRKGIVSGEEYGRLHFTLPLFDQFVLSQIV